jgi:hypothetical protein
MSLAQLKIFGERADEHAALPESFDMDKTVLMVIAFIAIAIVVFAGLGPLSGQKDKMIARSDATAPITAIR